MLPLDHPDRIQITFDDRAWWPMLGCSFRSRWPSTWVCVNWLTITWTWAMRRGGRMRATRC